MNRYRVAGGVAKFGPGQVLMLDPKQIKRRAHNLEIPKGYDGKEPAAVTSINPVEFIVGEVIGLPALAPWMVEYLVPLDEPKSEVDKVAIEKDTARAAASAGALAKAAAATPSTAKAKSKR